MNPQPNIVNQVKTVLDANRIPVMKLARETGIPVYRIYKWIDGTANPKDEDVAKLEKWLNQVAAGIPVQEMPSPDTSKIRLSLTDGRVYDVSGAPVAGTLEDWNNDVTVVLDFMRAPFVGEMDGVVEIVGDDMIPTFRPGQRVAIKRLTDPKIFAPGQVYFIIDRNGQSYVRRMYESGRDDVMFKADNTVTFPAFKRNWKDIRAVFKVKADINKL